MALVLQSTRDRGCTADLATGLLQGLAPDGGLYMPRSLPRLQPGGWRTAALSPAATAARVLEPLLDGAIPENVLPHLLAGAIDFPVPLVRLTPAIHVLELFHGPTLAFKDVAARTMARWIGWFRKLEEPPLTVLVATSGDTGGAVAGAFSGVPGARVVVLYPRGRVSELQEAQMTTLGTTVTAVAIAGSFDDCQRLVKEAFADDELRRTVSLTSANSINIGRLLPQIAYYFHAAAQLDAGEPPPIFAVPSGNLGNLTAGLLAARMGLPNRGFVAAANANDVFPEYLASGRFRPRPSVRTLSNAMDVGEPSNLERIRALYGDDPAAIRADVSASSWSDRATRQAIGEVWREYGYLMDPHTAVGYLALAHRLSREPAGTRGVLLATAHPAKFAGAVEEITGQRPLLPAGHADCLNLPRRAIATAPDYGELREILVTSSR